MVVNVKGLLLCMYIHLVDHMIVCGRSQRLGKISKAKSYYNHNAASMLHCKTRVRDTEADIKEVLSTAKLLFGPRRFVQVSQLFRLVIPTLEKNKLISVYIDKCVHCL